MTTSWRLPQGITDIPFEQATQLHRISTHLIKQYQSYGYQFVLPPIVEYDHNKYNNNKTDKHSFKTLDPTNGEMLAIQSDITPQIARIDAKYEKNNNIMRYCYVQGMLRTQSDDFYGGRNPIQAGVEIYGCSDSLADVEIIELMLNSLETLGLQNKVLVALGHIGILSELIALMELSTEQQNQVKAIFANRSKPDLIDFFNPLTIDTDLSQNLLDLMSYEGDAKVITQAKIRYKKYAKVVKILEELDNIIVNLNSNNISPYIDLAEFKMHSYYTGLLFSCVHKDYSKPLAQGGRYDGLLGSEHTQNTTSRSATGFSLDLKFLTNDKSLGKDKSVSKNPLLFAPKIMDAKLKTLIKQTRQNNQVVIRQLDSTKPSDFEFKNNQWCINKVDNG